MSDSAASLFEQFLYGDSANLDRVNKAIAESEPETLYLDFKRNASGGAVNAKPTDHTKEHLSRTVSAFANTEGGLIVWGVESKDGSANRGEPIPAIRDFVQEINTLTASSTTPIVAGVRTVWIEAESAEGHGFAVTYVPRSSTPPHQATVPKVKNYWMRSGSNCVVMEHRFIRALFEQRAHPAIDVRVSSPHYHIDHDNGQIAIFEVALRNVGEAIVREPAIAVSAGPFVSLRGLGMEA